MQQNVLSGTTEYNQSINGLRKLECHADLWIILIQNIQDIHTKYVSNLRALLTWV